MLFKIKDADYISSYILVNVGSEIFAFSQCKCCFLQWIQIFVGNESNAYDAVRWKDEAAGFYYAQYLATET